MVEEVSLSQSAFAELKALSVTLRKNLSSASAMLAHVDALLVFFDESDQQKPASSVQNPFSVQKPATANSAQQKPPSLLDKRERDQDGEQDGNKFPKFGFGPGPVFGQLPVEQAKKDVGVEPPIEQAKKARPSFVKEDE